MELSQSIFSLAKNNNGFFKSAKQSEFLTNQLIRFDGFIGHADSGYNTCAIFANWDKEGILKIVKSTKNGDVVMFERKQANQLTVLEVKKIKKLEKSLKALKKEINDNQNIFDSGYYNGSGDISTYSIENINLFNYFQEQKKNQCLEIEKIINAIK